MNNDQKHLSKLTCTATEFGALSAELLSKGNTVRFQAKGASMRPMVRDGDTLLIAPCPADDVQVGEIVLCSKEHDQVLVHRVLRKRLWQAGMQYLVQGDQVARPDGWIPRERIYGSLVEIERDGRRLTMAGGKSRFLGLLMVLAHRWGLRQSLLAGAISGLLRWSPGLVGYLK